MLRRGIGRVGRPGLVGTMARTAVIAGTATAVAGGGSRHQQQKAADQAQMQAYEDQQRQAEMQQEVAAQVAAQQAAPAPAAPAGGTDVIAQLQQLADLKAQGILTEEEFAAQKARILGS
jgi:Short C-terminal domain